MKNLKTILYPNKILRKESLTVNDFNSPDLKFLLDEMKRTIKEENGVGLAAVQLGIPLKVILIAPEKEAAFFLINPEITFFSKNKSYGIEGCLCLPKIFGSVMRSHKIKIKAMNTEGERIVLAAKSMTARIIQHEIDHLNGILFIDKAEQILEGQDKLVELNKNMISR